MSIPISEIAGWVGGVVVGDAARDVLAAKPLSDQPTSNELTVVLDGKYRATWLATGAAAVVPLDLDVPTDATVIRVADPLMAFVTIVQKLHVRPVRSAIGIHPTAFVDPSATVASDAVLGPYVVVGEGSVIGPRCVLQHGVSIGPYCTLGEDVVLYPHVVLYQGTILQHRVTLHAHVVIGADGFGYRTQQGRHVKSPHVGYVVIEDDVEIGACSSVDRGAFGQTRIGAGTKIDNHVQIAHNCHVGKHNLICAHVGMAGSVSTGDYVVLAGQVGIADHVDIGAGTLVGAQSGVHRDIPAGQRVNGTPTRPARDQAHIFAALGRLPEMREKLRRIMRHLGLKDDE